MVNEKQKEPLQGPWSGSLSFDGPNSLSRSDPHSSEGPEELLAVLACLLAEGLESQELLLDLLVETIRAEQSTFLT